MVDRREGDRVAAVEEAEQIAAATAAARQALQTLCELFFEHTRSSVTPLPSHFARLVTGLLPRVTAAERAELSRRLAHSDALPREIALALATDFIEVAGPMLRQSPVLDEETLLDIAGGADAERARCLAARTTLSRAVTEALVSREDPAIAEAMLSGPARPIESDIASRLAALPGLSGAAAERLVLWAELPKPALANLFWGVGPSTRRLIVERAVRGAARGADAASPRTSSNLELGTALFAAAASRRWSEVAVQLAAALGVPRSLAQRMVEDPGGEGLVIGCRAAGIGVSQLTSLLVLMPLGATEAPQHSHLRDLVTLAERLPTDVAAEFVGAWRGHQAQGHAPQHAPSVVEAQRVSAAPAARPAARGNAQEEPARRSFRR